MEPSNEYPGPNEDDYENVRALNSAFIKATSDLKGPQRGRLAAAPFLLFSLRENDLAWWNDALADEPQGDFLAASAHQNSELRRLQTAALSFVWQLARRDPYAVRIISGATRMWCEKLTAMPLLTLLDRIGARNDLIISRLEHSAPIGERLLDGGTSSTAKIRRSSQLTALQTLLTGVEFDDYARLPAAACNMSGPLRVLEKKM